MKPFAQHGVAQGQVEAGNEVLIFLKRCGLQMYAAQLLQSGFDEMETLHAIEDADMRDLGIPPTHASRLRKGLQELRAAAGNPVLLFLQTHGLEQYSAVFLGSGFDEMETLLEADDADLRDLGIPRGHVLKLKRHLRDYQIGSSTEEGQPAVQIVAPCSSQHPGAPAAAAQRPSRPVVERASAPEPAVRLDATEGQKGDVLRSWDMIVRVGTPTVAQHLHRVFFELLPEAMDAFPLHVRMKYHDFLLGEPEVEGDLHNSAALTNLFAKIVLFIGSAVAGLHESEKLVPLLTSLGMRHIGYRVREDYWPVLGKAIHITLRDLLGEAFTLEVKNAWTIVYGFMSQIMIQGLRRAIEMSQETRSMLSQGSRSSTCGSVASHDPVERQRICRAAAFEGEARRQDDDERGSLCDSTADTHEP